jgi:hypothetical protein
MNGQQLDRISIVRALCNCVCGLLILSVSFWNCSAAFSTPLATSPSDIVVTVTGFNPSTLETSSVDFNVPVNLDDTFDLEGATSSGNGWNLEDLSVSGNIDPFTILDYSITNTHPTSPMAFIVSVILPIAPLGPVTVHGGTMFGLLTDTNLDGIAVVSTVPGVPLYQGQIDFATVLSFYPDPYTQVVLVPGGSALVPPVVAGLPGPTLPSGPAFASIGILHVFALTPGDTFSGSSFFQVEVGVPEPSSLALVVLCFGGLATVRRT